MMKGDIDLALDNSKGYYDISIGPDGDLKGAKGLDTSLLVSLFTDGRAAASQQPQALQRRGWWGDLFTSLPIGSTLWIPLNAPLGIATSNQIVDAAQKALQWLITKGYADTIDVSTQVDVASGVVQLLIRITKNGIVTEKQYRILGST